MRKMLARIVDRLAVRKIVPINNCVHFCAYRYGRQEPNPYEQYAHLLAAGRPVDTIRRQFVEFLMHYRPECLGQALGIALSQSYPLWFLPWRRPRPALANPGWVDRPENVVDVMAFFAPAGIPRSGLEREFDWSENAFNSIRAFGYQPKQHSYVTVRELRQDACSAYLVLDGNHRLSAISALGASHVEVRVRQPRVNRGSVERWPLVRHRLMSVEDALLVFDAYFTGNTSPLQQAQPADIV